MSKYHEQAYTLDPNVEIPDDAPPAHGHNEQDAEKVKELHDEFREQAKKEAEEQSKRDEEFAERDPKPTPSEMLRERGHEPTPDDEDDKKESKKTTAKKKSD